MSFWRTNFDRLILTDFSMDLFLIFFHIWKEWSFYMILEFLCRADHENHGIQSANIVVQELSLKVYALLTWTAYNFWTESREDLIHRFLESARQELAVHMFTHKYQRKHLISTKGGISSIFLKTSFSNFSFFIFLSKFHFLSQ